MLQNNISPTFPPSPPAHFDILHLDFYALLVPDVPISPPQPPLSHTVFQTSTSSCFAPCLIGLSPFSSDSKETLYQKINIRKQLISESKPECDHNLQKKYCFKYISKHSDLPLPHFLHSCGVVPAEGCLQVLRGPRVPDVAWTRSRRRA